jgi:urea transport system ATP-binding protein
VDDLNFLVDRNELRVVIGPNGAGKTTLLDLICGKTKATTGSIMFKTRDLTQMKEHDIVRAGVGRKFQTPSIYENLTVSENLEVSFPRGRTAFGALFFRRTADVAERVKKVAEEVLLSDKLDHSRAAEPHQQKSLGDRDRARHGVCPKNRA